MGYIGYGTVGGLGGRFRLLRSYTKGFAITWPPGTTQIVTGFSWILTAPPAFGVLHKVMEFKPHFYVWNSNVYTFDWIFENFYDQVGSGPALPTDPFNLEIRRNPADGELYIAMNDGAWSDWQYMTMPPSPTGWWSG